MHSAIYRIANLIDGKEYVGSAVRVEERFRQHRRSLALGTHHSRYLQRAWNKHGRDAFVFEVLEECSRDALLDREQFYIDEGRPAYNICKQARSSLGVIKTAETRRRISIAKSNPSPETRERLAAAKRGTRQSPETRAKRSAAMRGQVWPSDFGAKISAAKMGHPVSDEARAKIAAAKRGRRQSKELIERRIAPLRGRPRSAETRAKISAGHRRRIELQVFSKTSTPPTS